MIKITVDDGLPLEDERHNIVDNVMKYLIRNNKTLKLADGIVTHVNLMEQDGKTVNDDTKKLYRNSLHYLIDAYIIVNEHYNKIYKDYDDILQEVNNYMKNVNNDQKGS